jgi:hypothetical protein
VWAAGDKRACVRLFEEGRVVRFGAKGSRFPQGCTDYERWKGATEDYTVTYCNRWPRQHWHCSWLALLAGVGVAVDGLRVSVHLHATVDSAHDNVLTSTP